MPHLAGIVLGELPLALPLNCSRHNLNALHVSGREEHSEAFIPLLFELFQEKELFNADMSQSTPGQAAFLTALGGRRWWMYFYLRSQGTFSESVL